MTEQVESSLDFVIPVLVTTFPFVTLHLVEVDFVLVLNVADLIVDVLLESRNDLLKSRKFRFDGSIGLSYIFDNDRFDFLEFGEVIVYLGFVALLAAEDLGLDVVHHLLEFLVLL